jgi:DNA-binding beta-propeller fold protein YncE
VYDSSNNYAAVATIPFERATTGLVGSPDGRRIYVAHPDSVSVIDTAANAPIGAPIDLGYGVFGSDLHKMAISPDGRSLYVTAGSSRIALTLIDTTTGVVSRPFDISHGLDAVAVSLDGHRVYATYSTPHFLPHGDYVTVLDSNTKAQIGDDIVVGYQPLALAVSADAHRLFAVNDVNRNSSHPSSSVSMIEAFDPPLSTK